MQKFEITSREVGNLIRKTHSEFQGESIVLAYRLGKEAGKKPRPCRVVVSLKSPSERDFNIGNAKEIKEKSGIESLRINHDQADSSKQKYALTKACYKRMWTRDTLAP